MTETQHGEGVGNLLEWRSEGIQIGNLRTVAAYEQIKAVLDPHQLFTECGDYRTHGVAVRTGQASPLFVDNIVVRQRIVEAILFFEITHTRRLRRRLGHIEQQVLAQLVGSSLVKAIGALF